MENGWASTNKKAAPSIGGTLTSGFGIGDSVAGKAIGTNLDRTNKLFTDRKFVPYSEENFLTDTSDSIDYSQQIVREGQIISIPESQEQKTTSTLNVYPANYNTTPAQPNVKAIRNKMLDKLANHEIAELLMQNHRFAVIKKNLYFWSPRLNHYVGLAGDQADIFLRQNVPDNLKERISVRTSDEIIRWLISIEKLEVDVATLARMKVYVPFANCIVRFSDLSVHSHSPNFYFTSVIKADYPMHQMPCGRQFEKYINWVTGGNIELYLRLQELFGYVLSEIRDVKIIPFLLGPKDSGKSIILNLLVQLIGEEFSTSLSLDEMNRPEFLCQLFGKKLNACGEISELPLTRLDTLKKLTGGDFVMARFLYANAIRFQNTAALLFAGNHLPMIKGGVDRSNAFSQRLRIFPFPNRVAAEDQDIRLLDKLLEERSYIVKWALLGLKRWAANNFQFTTSDLVEELAENYSVNNDSIKSFVNNYCILHPDLRTHNSVLIPAYKEFCMEHDFIPESEKVFHKHMQQVERLKHSRFRDNDENQFGYYGIGLHND